jgi:DNA-binding transcriptional ArsR family regulator
LFDKFYDVKVIFGIMELSDPKAIRALAHPLRLDLLELLVAIGPATAAQCGRAMGASQATCSFHLRQLGKYGFVEDAGPGPDRRERLWRIPAGRPEVRIPGNANATVARELHRVVVQRAAQAMLDFADRQDADSQHWHGKAGLISAVAVLTPDEAAELRRQWKALLEPYLTRHGEPRLPGQRYVRYLLAATPLADTEEAGSD